MKKIYIFEPAMCCPTGVCGPSVDSELLRITGAITTANKRETLIERFNLKDHPMKFVEFSVINQMIQDEGIDVLPIAIFEDEIIMKSGYPSNDKIEELLDIKLTEEKSAFKMV